MPLPNTDGKISAGQIRSLLEDYQSDANHEHMVMPGMVYLSQPTEYGTLYSLEELTEISAVCRAQGLPLYVDGARLAYALACPENDVSLPDLARLCDAFYIGGTKCGTLLGEAVVIPKAGLIPHLFTMIKQHGALLAKGRILGIQFDALFTDGLYEKIGIPALAAAKRIREALADLGYRLYFDSPTNQIFCVVDHQTLSSLEGRVEYGFWEKFDEDHTVIRLARSWAA
jgi:threonine aldolase